jgi:hypothetical protein
VRDRVGGRTARERTQRGRANSRVGIVGEGGDQSGAGVIVERSLVPQGGELGRTRDRPPVGRHLRSRRSLTAVDR